jgi:Uma2 family endonuclease
MEMYQRNGVQEYWIVDPDEHWVDQFVLQCGRYGTAVRELTRISAITIPDTIVDLLEVWA